MKAIAAEFFWVRGFGEAVSRRSPLDRTHVITVSREGRAGVDAAIIPVLHSTAVRRVEEKFR